MDGESIDIKQDKLQKLKELFPELFAENQLDWEKLKAAFGDDINFVNERYVLNWAGKSDAFRVLQQPTTATLKPAPEESVNFDTTEHLFIEGENLEVLKVLQKAYYGKVKVVCIDPPYNTGSDSFIYPDRFSEKKEDYLKRIGDKDEEGYLMKEGLFRKNSKDSGHYHSNWLSMMYPRLFLAKNLLRDDGVIFVHIDDNEVHNLRMVMNEIFGEENFVANFPRVTKKAGKTTDTIAKNNDYVLCYQKTENSELNSYSHTDEGYKNCDEFEETRGKYKLSQTLDYGSIQYSPSLDYEIEIKGMVLRPGNVTKKEMDERKKRNPSSDFCWRWSKDLYQFGLKNGFIVLKESKNGFRLYTKTYEKATISKNNHGYFVEIKQRTKSATTLDFIENEYSNDNSRKDIGKVFDGKVFEYSKPVSLIKTLLFLSSNDSDIILDFFGGSGTTAQAVLELNKEDGGNRKFILVQLPEQCDENSEAYKAGYKTIADIAKERIRRVIKKIQGNTSNSHSRENGNPESLFKDKNMDSRLRTAGMTKEYSNDNKPDLGFKVFKLSPSSFKIWSGSEIDSEEKLAQQMDAFTNPIRPGAEKQNMLYELMLKAGYELTSPVQYVIASKAMQSQGKKVASGSTNPRNDSIGYYSINNNELIIALDAVNEKLIEQIITAKPQKVITLDSLFTGNDQLKTNTVLQMRDAGVDFKTI